jgi:cell division protein ZapE
MQLTPQERYQLDVKERGLTHDEAQVKAVSCLQQLYEDLLKPRTHQQEVKFGFFKRKIAPPPLKGVYLWGGVGRGKTYLIDSFFACLLFHEKRRVHFQRFMKDVHETLKRMPKSPDPLPIVAGQLAEKARVICLDEFHVDDVADAMLLAGLLQSLMERGVVMVFTSNIPPDELYLNGLQRQRFIPAIELIKQNSQVVHLDSSTDYRIGLVSAENGFFAPHDERAREIFKQLVEQKAQGELSWAGCLTINQREMKTVAHGDAVIWLTFDEICGTAKSYYDYLIIAERFKTVMLSSIPEMKSGMDDVANRFIQLIDALYDHNNELIVSAAVTLPKLYSGQRLAFPFQRTQSRLEEMFSRRYVTKHKKTVAM